MQASLLTEVEAGVFAVSLASVINVTPADGSFVATPVAEITAQTRDGDEVSDFNAELLMQMLTHGGMQPSLASNKLQPMTVLPDSNTDGASGQAEIRSPNVPCCSTTAIGSTNTTTAGVATLPGPMLVSGRNEFATLAAFHNEAIPPQLRSPSTAEPSSVLDVPTAVNASTASEADSGQSVDSVLTDVVSLSKPVVPVSTIVDAGTLERPQQLSAIEIPDSQSQPFSSVESTVAEVIEQRTATPTMSNTLHNDDSRADSADFKVRSPFVAPTAIVSNAGAGGTAPFMHQRLVSTSYPDTDRALLESSGLSDAAVSTPDSPLLSSSEGRVVPTADMTEIMRVATPNRQHKVLSLSNLQRTDAERLPDLAVTRSSDVKPTEDGPITVGITALAGTSVAIESGSTVTPASGQHSSIAGQIVAETLRQATLHVDRDRHNFTMRLDPPELGRLTIQMERTSDVTRLVVQADNFGTETLIRDSIMELQSTSSQQETSLKGMEISVSSDRGSSYPNRQQERSEFRRGPRKPVAPSTSQPEKRISFVA